MVGRVARGRSCLSRLGPFTASSATPATSSGGQSRVSLCISPRRITWVDRDTQFLRARSRPEGIVPAGNRGRSRVVSDATTPERVPPRNIPPRRGVAEDSIEHLASGTPARGAGIAGGSAFRWCRCARPPAIFCDACGIRARQARQATGKPGASSHPKRRFSWSPSQACCPGTGRSFAP